MARIPSPELEAPCSLKPVNLRHLLFLYSGPDIKPNLWMWVNPNIVYPPGKLEVAVKKEDLPACQPALKEEEDSCSEALETGSPPRKQKRKQKEKHVASSPSIWEEVWMGGHRVEAPAAGFLRANKR